MSFRYARRCAHSGQRCLGVASTSSSRKCSTDPLPSSTETESRELDDHEQLRTERSALCDERLVNGTLRVVRLVLQRDRLVRGLLRRPFPRGAATSQLRAQLHGTKIMCFPFLAALGHSVGRSLCPHEDLEPAREALVAAAGSGRLELPAICCSPIGAKRKRAPPCGAGRGRRSR